MEYKHVDGIKISNVLYEELNKYLSQQQKVPTIVDISIGDDLGGLLYSKMKKKKIEEKTNISFKSIHFNNIDYSELQSHIINLNNNEHITGIMLQLPLPINLKSHEREILELIKPCKDVDGLTSTSAGLLSVGENCLIPCTALGIETILKVYDVLLEGKKVAIINRSNIVGKPLAQLMLRNNATPIVCHSKTNDLRTITNDCDVIVVALNKREYIDDTYISNGSVVIDVGVHKNEFNKTVGDVDFTKVAPKTTLITPPTGAVGPMTICMLAYNSAIGMYGQEVNEVLNTGIVKAKKLIKKSQ